MAKPSMLQMDGTRIPIDLPKHVIPQGEVYIIDDRCKECGLCVEFCPKDILEMSERYNKKGYKPPQMIDSLADECIACSFCEDICPELAIYVEEEIAA